MKVPLIVFVFSTLGYISTSFLFGFLSGKRRKPPEVICQFCGDFSAMSGSPYCSGFCEHSWRLNGNQPAYRCVVCGWKGCHQQFGDGRGICLKCLGEDEEEPGISDEDFEGYRAKILESLETDTPSPVERIAQ